MKFSLTGIEIMSELRQLTNDDVSKMALVHSDGRIWTGTQWTVFDPKNFSHQLSWFHSTNQCLSEWRRLIMCHPEDKDAVAVAIWNATQSPLTQPIQELIYSGSAKVREYAKLLALVDSLRECLGQHREMFFEYLWDYCAAKTAGKEVTRYETVAAIHGDHFENLDCEPISEAHASWRFISFHSKEDAALHRLATDKTTFRIIPNFSNMLDELEMQIKKSGATFAPLER